MMRPRTRKLVAVAALVAALAGCGDRQPASAPAARGGPGATLTPAALDLVTRTGTWASTEGTLTRAESLLVRRCMRAAGFAYPEEPEPTAPVVRDNGDEDIDLPSRERYGYGLAPASDAARPPVRRMSAADAYAAGLAPAEQERFQAALAGPAKSRRRIELPGGLTVDFPGKGCVAESRTALAGDLDTSAYLGYLPEQLGNRLAEGLPTAPGYLAALAAWRSCLTARGYPYPSPELARETLRDRYDKSGDSATLRREERAVAVADGECALRVRLPAAVVAAKRELAVALPEPERRQLAEVCALRSAATERAMAVLGTTGK